MSFHQNFDDIDMRSISMCVLVTMAVAITILNGCHLNIIDETTVGGKENTDDLQIEMETPEILFSTQGGNSPINFHSDQPWTARVINSRADSWCSIFPESGPAGDSQIIVTTLSNDTLDNRAATIVIEAGNVSKTIVVSQKQKDALTLTSSIYEIGASGGEISIEVKANIDFEYAIDGLANDWIEYMGTRSLETFELTFTVSENSNVEKREGRIVFNSGEINEVVTVFQSGTEPSIVISKNEYVVSSNSETIAIAVTSNVNVSVEIPAGVEWIKENATRSASTNTFYFDILHNETYDERSAEIKFLNVDNDLFETVRIVQMQRDALIVAKQIYNVGSTASQIQIEVGRNVGFDIEILDTWISIVETRTFAKEILIFNIASNAGYDSREGTIVFCSKDGAISQIVKIYQEQADALLISKKVLTISDEGGTISFDLQANVDYLISDPDAEWLHAVDTRGLSTHTKSYIVDANESYSLREAHIVVTDLKNSMSQMVTVIQSQKDAIIINEDCFSVGSKGGQVYVDVASNVDYDIDVSDAWIKYVYTKSLQNHSVTFEVQPNMDKIDREGFVKFISHDRTISRVVCIKQSCANGNIEDIENGDINEW